MDTETKSAVERVAHELIVKHCQDVERGVIHVAVDDARRAVVEALSTPAPPPSGEETRPSVADIAAQGTQALRSEAQHSAGWRLVPDEPTEAMLRAGYEARWPKPGSVAFGWATWATWEQACELPTFRDEWAAVYRAMIALASSQNPAREGVER